MNTIRTMENNSIEGSKEMKDEMKKTETDREGVKTSPIKLPVQNPGTEEEDEMQSSLLLQPAPQAKKLRAKRCEMEGCEKHPLFGYPGGKRRFCASHKLQGMIDVKNKVCEQEGCTKISLFDYIGKRGRFCARHKLEGMINVKAKHCEAPNCVKQPYYDYEGGKGRFCKEHKLAEMMDVKTRRCEYEGCKKVNPVFGLEGERGRFCATHKLPGMSDVKSRRCQAPGCKKQPYFNVEGGSPQFCATHKSPNMIDVKHRRCEYKGCTRQPIFGWIGEKGRFCGEHKLHEMVNLKHSKRHKIDPSLKNEEGKGMHDTIGVGIGLHPSGTITSSIPHSASTPTDPTSTHPSLSDSRAHLNDQAYHYAGFPRPSVPGHSFSPGAAPFYTQGLSSNAINFQPPRNDFIFFSGYSPEIKQEFTGVERKRLREGPVEDEMEKKIRSNLSFILEAADITENGQPVVPPFKTSCYRAQPSQPFFIHTFAYPPMYQWYA